MIKEIPVKDIEIIENSRTRTDISDVSLLMKDIKQNGLLHPIGVYEEKGKHILLFGSRRLQAFKKLGYDKIPASIIDKPTEQDLLLINTSENLHRVDLRPHELGRICLLLLKQGLNKKEIASRLGLAETKVENVIKIIQQVPKELLNDIQNVKNTRNIDGKLSTETVGRILNIRTTSQNQMKLLKFAKANGVTSSDIRNFDHLFRAGKDFDEALKEMKNCQTKQVYVIFKIKQLEAFLKAQKISFGEYILEVLKGQRKPNTSIVI